MTSTATTALGNLGSLILGDHPLKLNQELIFRSLQRRSLHKNQLYPTAGELFRQQYLICVLAAETIRRVDQHGGNLALRRQVAYRLQSRSGEHGATITFVLKLPRRGHVVAVG